LTSFSDFDFDPRLQEGIDASNYQTPTPVQAQVIPNVLLGKDVIAFAQTGTGKTAAFLLPLINRLLTVPHNNNGIVALVIVPTRELAIQIAQHVEGLSYFAPISSLAIFGGGDGSAFIQEKTTLTMGADIVICTPGRLMAHINMGYVNFKNLQYLILDEADRMLDMGFNEDISYIIKQLPEKRQNLMFSATMAPKIKMLAKNMLHNPVEVSIALSKPPEKIQQFAIIVYDKQKKPTLIDLLKNVTFNKIVVFCNSKQSVKQLNFDLIRAKINAAEIHSDLQQEERETTLMHFTSGKIRVLVATDLLSRGVDIDGIDAVINYDAPRDAEDYVHRIGRTARAEAAGTAYTFVNEKDQYKFRQIEKLIGKEVEKIKLAEFLGPQPEYGASAPERGSRNFKGNRRFSR
jgi:ATP-dependent RNA helicase RhlE